MPSFGRIKVAASLKNKLIPICYTKPMQPYTGNDIYCDRIIPNYSDGIREIEIIKETDAILAFYHTKPFYSVHVVVVPKRHIPSLLELDDASATELLHVVQEIAGQVQTETGASRVQTNLGEYQDSKHLHIHITSGKPL